ncbi:MAG: SulA-like leucine-rich domain-containing protein [Gammaproteobacteria bacterium]|nr:SulA-like leucine-rich domain-containing protein [Gammaproteobacteria bacterium]
MNSSTSNAETINTVMRVAANEDSVTLHDSAATPESVGEVFLKPFGQPMQCNPQPDIKGGGQKHRGYSSGFPQIDRRLPDGGWPRYGLIQVISRGQSSLESMQLLLPLIRSVIAQGKWILWAAPPCDLADPTLLHAGIDTRKIFVIKVETSCKEAAESMEKALLTPNCGLVLVGQNWLPDGFLRRLQRTAEVGNSLAIIFKNNASKHSHSLMRLPIKGSTYGRECSDVELILPEVCHPMLFMTDRAAH